MKTNVTLLVLAVILSTLNSQLATLFAQGTAFTYQGRLNTGGSPANGSYDIPAISNQDAQDIIAYLKLL